MGCFCYLLCAGSLYDTPHCTIPKEKGANHAQAQ